MHEIVRDRPRRRIEYGIRKILGDNDGSVAPVDDRLIWRVLGLSL